MVTQRNKSPLHVSLIIPAFNAERYIGGCLESIFSQNYARDRIEVLIVDGGSTDKTLEIAGNFPVRVITNKNRDAESGKSLGIENARGQVIAYLDADNELASQQWLTKMVRPLMDDPEIFGVESSWLVNENDPMINRYCMHIEVVDPLVYCLRPNIEDRRQNGYFLVDVNPEYCPIAGGGGFLWRKEVIVEVGGYKPRFEEINFFSRVVQRGFRKYARVPEQKIHHHYVANIQDFVRKRVKIGSKFIRRVQKRQTTWVHIKGKKKFILAVLFCLSVIGPAFEAVKGYKRTRDIAWFLHPLMSFLTVTIYGIELITHATDAFGY